MANSALRLKPNARLDCGPCQVSMRRRAHGVCSAPKRRVPGISSRGEAGLATTVTLPQIILAVHMVYCQVPILSFPVFSLPIGFWLGSPLQLAGMHVRPDLASRLGPPGRCPLPRRCQANAQFPSSNILLLAVHIPPSSPDLLLELDDLVKIAEREHHAHSQRTRISRIRASSLSPLPTGWPCGTILLMGCLPLSVVDRPLLRSGGICTVPRSVWREPC